MQKVVGSSPIIRFTESPAFAGLSSVEEVAEEPGCSVLQAVVRAPRPNTRSYVARPRTGSAGPAPALLRVPREQFANELDERLAIGRELHGREIRSVHDLEAARSDYYTWSEYNTELLTADDEGRPLSPLDAPLEK